MPDPPTETGAPRPDRATRWRLASTLPWILVASLALKLSILAWMGDVAPDGDERQYVTAGRLLAQGNGIRYLVERWSDLHYPPLYPYFLGLVYRLGWGSTGAKIVQVLLSTASVWFVFLLGSRALGARVGTVAAAIFAFYPSLIGFSHYLFAETVFLFWFLAGLALLFDEGAPTRSVRRLLVAGLLLGAAALTREVVVYLLPLTILWMLLATGEPAATARRGGALLLGCALVVLPWSLDVHRRYGGFLLVSSGNIQPLYQNYNAFPPPNYDWGFPRPNEEAYRDHELYRPYPREETNPVVLAGLERRRAIRFMLEHPLLCFERFWTRVAYFLNPTSFVVRHVRRGVYTRDANGEPFRERAPPVAEEAVVLAVLSSYVLVALLAVAGLWAMPAGPPRAFLLWIVLSYVAIHGMTYGMSRYRLSIIPLVMIATAWALTHVPECARRLRSTRGLLALGTILALGYAWSLHAGKIWADA